jgi:hypothetical protein
MPKIVIVDDVPSTPLLLPMSSHNIASAKWHSAGYSWVEPKMPTQNNNIALADLSPLDSSSITSTLERTPPQLP